MGYANRVIWVAYLAVLSQREGTRGSRTLITWNVSDESATMRVKVCALLRQVAILWRCPIISLSRTKNVGKI